MKTSSFSSSLICKYFPICQGCSLWHIPYSEQKSLKIKSLTDRLSQNNLAHPPAELISLGECGLRQRVDFTMQRNLEQRLQMGFYNQEKKLLNIDECLQLSPALQKFYSDFQKIDFPIQKGSVRLRVSPSGKKGAWFDFSNLDIKRLLDDSHFFNQFFDQKIHVEVGQKGKSVLKTEVGFKLTEPTPHDWFETYDQNLQPISLQGLISDFTQPSWLTARAMIEIIFKWTQSLPSEANTIEFGPGLGQFTLPLLSRGSQVSVYESNATATAALERNAKRHSLDHLLKVNFGDFQNKSFKVDSEIDLALVNPPRSGLKNFSYELIRTGAKKCIYISCFPESMVVDLKILNQAGYEIKDIKIIDQFPQTEHFETCVLLEKSI